MTVAHVLNFQLTVTLKSDTGAITWFARYVIPRDECLIKTWELRMALEQYKCKSPVLLIIFNRPDLTNQVLESLRSVRPEKLYVAADGPRAGRPEEAIKCIETRKVLDAIDWECDVKTQFQAHNLGVKLGVKSAIDWFFSSEDAGIVLEDDTVPIVDFFRFCDEMLELYERDNRVGVICGSHTSKYTPPYASYFFSRDRGSWGWATWSRSWKHMDLEMSWRKRAESSSIRANLAPAESVRQAWDWRFKLLENGSIETWDWQWAASLASQNQLAIFPATNLVSNIGFGTEATHTTGSAPPNVLETSEMSWPLRHPQYVVPDLQFTEFLEANEINLLRRVHQDFMYFLSRVKRKLVRRFSS